MKSFKRLLTACVLGMLLLLSVSSVHAAESLPGKIKNLKETAHDEHSVSLKWSAVSGADGYTVYQLDSKGNKTKIKNVTDIRYTVKNLKYKKSYSFQVFAYKVSGDKKLRNPDGGSPIVIVKTTANPPAPVKNLRIGSYQDQNVTLKWDEAKGADGYYIYQYNTKTEKYVKVGSSKSTYGSPKGLKAGKEYYFAIKPYKLVGKEKIFGELTKKIKVKPKKIDMSDVHGRYYNTTLKSTTTVKVKDSKKEITLKSGTQLVAKQKNREGYVEAIYKDKTIVIIHGSKLNYNSLNTTYKYYSKEQLEAFVNEKRLSSKTNYLIWLSQYTMSVAVFQGSVGEWKLIRKMPCVIGRNGNTPESRYTLVKKGYMYGDIILYVKYFGGYGYGFHTNRLGSHHNRGAESGGCMRLEPSDLHWMSNTCPLGTYVLSY